MPTLPPDAGILIRPCGFIGTEHLRFKGEIVLAGGTCGILIIAAQPQSGCSTVAVPEDTRSLGRIDPNADRGRCAGHGKRLGGTDACALGHSAAISEVIVQLQTVRTHTDRLVIVDTDDLGRLYAAPAIVGSIQQAGAVPVCVLLVNGIILLSRDDCCFTRVGIRYRYILKIPDNNGQLTDHHCELVCDLRLCRIVYLDRARDRQAIVRGIGTVRIECSHSVIGLCPGKITGVIVDVSALIFHIHGQFFRHVKAKAHFLGLELKRIRMYQFNACRANNISAAAQLNSDLTYCTVSAGEQACCLVDRAHIGAIRTQSPCNILRQVRCCTCTVNAGGGELHGRTGGIQIIVRRKCCVVKLSRGFCFGDDHQASERRPLNTVRGGVLNLKIAASLSLRNEGGRSAAVTVDRLHTAKAKHGLRQLIHGHTHGIWRLTSIHNEQNDASIRFDANGSSRCPGAGGVISRAIHAHTVAHQPAESGGRLPLIALKGRRGIAQLCFAILGQDKIRLSIVCLVVNLAIDHQHAQRLV